MMVDWLAQLTCLKSLDMSGTNIMGDINNWKSLSHLIQLEELYMYRTTKITGAISQWESVKHLTQLKILSLAGSEIKGDNINNVVIVWQK